MKILHTADWHLGQNFFERDRLEEQSAFLDFLLKQIETRSIDLLIIAGDIFDTANPPRAAEQLYFDFITRLHALQHCEAVIIGGNHDSAPHLDAPRTVLSHLNIHVIGGMPDQTSDAILRFERNGKRLCIAAIPFLRDRDVRRAIEGESFDAMEARTKAGIIQTYQNIAQQIQTSRQDDEVLLATGHLTAVGGRLSDSERSVHIGNLGSISAEQFPPIFDYIALGHLHHPQAVGACEHIRYSGSPIPLSFSESSEKEIRLLTIHDDHSLTHQAIDIPLARRLLRLSGSADTVRQAIEELSTPSHELTPWIEVTLTEGDVSPLINDQIRAAAAANDAVVLKVGRKLNNSQISALPDQTTKAISEWEPLAVFEKRIESYQGDLSPEALKQCFNHILHAVQEDDAQ
ncbi:exonuclease SbcCD subunit D C-terminal domain-containing protein [Coraliomargarita algicola]|uniref:Nuclease SbcCD subunit D n=1 Tax=Coraliomargarita algicola TaxID=3092156 RepID=A0ABZ0RIQ8_9BACT|nr:exonuclease SbcCD subunit D C-terminal domain-containing protein [Coraliomargarita sp. J2-16]WPJ94963.1 exonuclease SbcCD subunit D C-terminal domain-containing protein [Coraliomargarita sp. J2-16]